MLSLLLSSLLLAAITATIGLWIRSQFNAQSKSWEQILGRLNRNWNPHQLSEHFPWRLELASQPRETWLRLNGVQGLITMYRNARVMMELADYAAEHCSPSNPVDPIVLATIRSEAMQVRILVIVTITQYVLLRATESVCVNAHRSATLYTSMAAQLTSLLQNHAGTLLPAYIDAL